MNHHLIVVVFFSMHYYVLWYLSRFELSDIFGLLYVSNKSVNKKVLYYIYYYIIYYVLVVWAWTGL